MPGRVTQLSKLNVGRNFGTVPSVLKTAVKSGGAFSTQGIGEPGSNNIKQKQANKQTNQLKEKEKKERKKETKNCMVEPTAWHIMFAGVLGYNLTTYWIAFRADRC